VSAHQQTGVAPSVLIDKLRDAAGNTTRTTALLWTWLESNLLALGSLREKPSIILESVLSSKRGGSPLYTTVDEQTLAWLAQAPLRNAAELLARIALEFGDATMPVLEWSTGIDGRDVLVAWNGAQLVRLTSDKPVPPSAAEHPALASLSPSLVVSPRTAAGITLTPLAMYGPEWDVAEMRMRQAMISQDPEGFAVHLDTLGADGRSGWTQEPGAHVGRYAPEAIATGDERACSEAAVEAISAAAGPCSILIMPELAATPNVLEVIRRALDEQAQAPVLTVIGLYHEPTPPDSWLEALAGSAPLAEYHNEAVVLGANGSELWRHRKLSCASGDVDDSGGPQVHEDIRLGDRLTVVPTPLGVLALAICLDVFARHSRERIATSPANLLLIPSLSPHVRRHRDSVQHLVQALWGLAFVCNRAPEPGDDAACVWEGPDVRSFWAIQRRPLSQPAPSAGGRPSFVFHLQDLEGRP
jgi:hypothetical protein